MLRFHFISLQEWGKLYPFLPHLTDQVGNLQVTPEHLHVTFSKVTWHYFRSHMTFPYAQILFESYYLSEAIFWHGTPRRWVSVLLNGNGYCSWLLLHVSLFNLRWEVCAIQFPQCLSVSLSLVTAGCLFSLGFWLNATRQITQYDCLDPIIIYTKKESTL